MPKISLTLTVANSEGLHMRPMMKFVDAANAFSSSVRVCKPEKDPNEVVDGKSVMGMMTIVDVQGTKYQIDLDGDDAETAAETIRTLFEEKFGEE